jgi:AraC family transcriptional regulator
LAKIAHELDSESASGVLTARSLAQGDGWAVSDILCTAGPRHRPFEEQHSSATIAIVIGGTFQYRSLARGELMTPGSLLLGNPGQSFECGHEHGVGDRCISFSYRPEFFERLTADAGARGGVSEFKAQRLPPIGVLSPVIARASAALSGFGSADAQWEELSIRLAAQTIQLDRGLSTHVLEAQPGALARVTRVVRMIERHPEIRHDIPSLAREARLSPYHFLRTFEILTGTTPHQYLLRVRLRRAAVRVSTEPTKILDIALDSGFGDVSNFNRTFRSEFGSSPRGYRKQTQSSGRQTEFFRNKMSLCSSLA